MSFVTGSLGPGGAERQLFLAARELAAGGAEVTVHALTRGETYEARLETAGISVRHFGAARTAAARAAGLAGALCRSRPHVVHATHFFCNLYAAAGARLCDAISVGSLRSDLAYELESNPRWGEALLRAPDLLLANSRTARQRAARHGLDPERIGILPNAVDVAEFDAAAVPVPRADPNEVRALFLGSLLPVKRVGLFLEGVAEARRHDGRVRGYVIGDGPEGPTLARLAAELGLAEGGVVFLGRRNDAPAWLAAGDILVLCSIHEGLPNAVLEAMTARLPVIVTPAGDAPVLVEDGVNGFVVGHGDAVALGERIARLAGDRAMRARFGAAGRAAVERDYGRGALRPRLLSIYAGTAQRLGRPALPMTGAG